MKPVLRRAFPSSNFININLNANFGSKNTLAKIQGSVKKLGQQYEDATMGWRTRVFENINGDKTRL